jgi:hypothetical protein
MYEYSTKIKRENNVKVPNRIFEINNIKIIQRDVDNYVNLTAIFSVSGKRTDTWFETVKTKTLIETLITETNLPRTKLLIYERGSNPPCQYVHPKIAKEYAKWCNFDDLYEWIIIPPIEEENDEMENIEIENDEEISIECENEIIEIEGEILKDKKKKKKKKKDIIKEGDSLTIADQKVISRKSDGYINVNQLCKAGKKKFCHWNEIEKSKEFLEVLSSSINKNINELLMYKLGSNSKRATWAHPQVAINIAQWISPWFSIELYKWIDEWKEHNSCNKNKFITTLNDIKNNKIYNNKTVESTIKHRLAKELNGDMEVNTIFGRIDIVTNNEIIEIKHFNQWKHAFGQILSYSKFYVNHNMRLHLFYFKNKTVDNLKEIENYLSEYNIKITIEEVEEII